MLLGVAAASSDDAWAVGKEQLTSVAQPALIEHWNGQAWAQVPSPQPNGAQSSSLYGVAAVSGDDAWAVGNSQGRDVGRTLAEHWNGQTWTKVTSPNGGWGGALTAVSTVSADDAWVVGQSLAKSLRPTALAERWNGRAWSL
jgi:hypothetical protein